MAKHRLEIKNFTELKCVSSINLLAGQTLVAGNLVHMKINDGRAYKGYSSFSTSSTDRTELYGIACNDADVNKPVKVMLRGVFCGVDFESMAPNVNAGDIVTMGGTNLDALLYTDDRRLVYTTSGSAAGFVLTSSTLDGKLNMATPVIYNGHIII